MLNPSYTCEVPSFTCVVQNNTHWGATTIFWVPILIYTCQTCLPVGTPVLIIKCSFKTC